jgi:hypothetical protein
MYLSLLGNQLKSIFPRAPAELVTVIYNHRFTHHDEAASGETFIPSVSQLRSKKAIHHGRQIPEIKPEEINTETRQNQRRQRKSQGGCGGQTSRRQKEISGQPIISLELEHFHQSWSAELRIRRTAVFLTFGGVSAQL